MSKIRDFSSLGDIFFCQRRLRTAFSMNDRLFILDLLPLETLLGTRHIETLAVLSGGIEEAASNLGDDIGTFDFERRRFESKGTVVFLDQLVANTPRPMADNAFSQRNLPFGRVAENGQAGADAVCGVPHRRQSGPI